MAFLEGKGNGDSSRARLTLCNRLRAGLYQKTALLSWSLHSTKETQNQQIKQVSEFSTEKWGIENRATKTVRVTDKRLLKVTGRTVTAFS